jgi:hypothetical protein
MTITISFFNAYRLCKCGVERVLNATGCCKFGVERVLNATGCCKCGVERVLNATGCFKFGVERVLNATGCCKFGVERVLSWRTTLEGGEGSASRPGRSLPPGKIRYPLYRRLGGPQGRSGQVQKVSPSPELDAQTVQPVASRYTDWATGPTYGYLVTHSFVLMLHMFDFNLSFCCCRLHIGHLFCLAISDTQISFSLHSAM